MLGNYLLLLRFILRLKGLLQLQDAPHYFLMAIYRGRPSSEGVLIVLKGSYRGVFAQCSGR